MKALVVLVAITGCYRPSEFGNCALSCATTSDCPDDLGCGASGLCSTTNQCASDVPGDGGGDAAAACFGQFWQPCVTPHDTTIALQGLFSTDLDQRCQNIAQPDDTVVCVLAASDMITTSNFRAQGTRPLVLSANKVVVDGLDVSSDQNIVGAGSCTTIPPDDMKGKPSDDTLSVFYGAGGAGASNQGTGGGGGGVDLSMSANDGVPGAPTQALAPPTTLVGGCPGGDGAGSDNAPTAFGAGGFGGGAVLVVARDEIDVTAAINASGSGGGGARLRRGGGGGGGAGGLIVLDAPMVVLDSTSRLLANGGGGGAGTGDNAVTVDGGNPDAGVDTAAMATGAGANSGRLNNGSGGDGSASGDVAGFPGESGLDFGGGGGGGAGGFILVFSPVVNGMALYEVPTSTRP